MIGPMAQAERIVRTCSHCAEAQPIDAGRAVGGWYDNRNKSAEFQFLVSPRL